MPSKKKKYNARFPAGRIKKIMQTDEEVGKVAQAVPVIISRTLELFVESLLTKTLRITNARNAKTLSPSHMKQCIISESRFDFLRDLVKNIPDIGVNEEQLSGSEAGYGTEVAGTSPASTSASSSSNGGTSATVTTIGEGSSVAMLLQRSESYSPASSSSSNYASILPIQQMQQRTQQSSHQLPQTQINLKRTIQHSNSLNFYKEISLEESSETASSSTSTSSVASKVIQYRSREPPPKLARLHSAPAAPATATIVTATSNPLSSIPSFKIDILPNLPTTAVSTPSSSSLASSSSNNNNNSQHQQQAKANTGVVASSNNFKITYKIAPVEATAVRSNPPTSTATISHQQPVIKLDYSNLKLPMATEQQLPKQQQQVQPTIKIDLSNITNFSSKPQQSPTAVTAALLGGSSISLKQVPLTPTASSTPSTPLSALSLASSSSSGSSSSSSSRNPYMFSQQSVASSSTAATAGSSSSSSAPMAPLYSSVSSTIPGMDEDYDDI